MGFLVNSTMPLISPRYSDMEFTLEASSANYLTLELYIGDASKANWNDGDLRTLTLLGSSATNVDIQGVVQPFFSSDASAYVELKRVDVKAHYFLNSVDTSVYVDKYYVFNGVDRPSFKAYNYIFDGSVNADFLNRWNSPINIHPDDKNVNLYFFHGIFENSTGRYDVSTASFEIIYGSKVKNYKTTEDIVPSIYKLNIDPSNLNSLVADLSINNNTLATYTVDPSRNSSSIYKKTVNIVAQDNRYTSKRVTWVDSMGCINSFNFDLVQENEINVDKDTYWNNGTLKQYNNYVEDVYTITSNWVTEAESLALKDLWYSPSIIIDGEYAIIQNKKTEIKKRRTDRLINYTIEYILSNEYLVQIS